MVSPNPLIAIPTRLNNTNATRSRGFRIMNEFGGCKKKYSAIAPDRKVANKPGPNPANRTTTIIVG
jgi:hypothetical protein